MDEPNDASGSDANLGNYKWSTEKRICLLRCVSPVIKDSQNTMQNGNLRERAWVYVISEYATTFSDIKRYKTYTTKVKAEFSRLKAMGGVLDTLQECSRSGAGGNGS
jgi:hypothetical protein